MSTELSSQFLDLVEARLKRRGGFVTVNSIERAIRQAVQQANQRQQANRPSLSKLIRGMSASALNPIVLNQKTVSEDVAYLRALSTESTPGSYLVPTIQSASIIELLAQFSAARAAGATIWPLNKIQKLTIPLALASPSFIFLAQNSKQTPTDPNLGQLSFDLVSARALILVPTALFVSAVPAFDSLLESFFADGMAEAEDAAMFASSTQANGPMALMSKAGIVTVNVGNSANGGNLAFSDLTKTLETANAAKIKPPLCWFASPRTLTRLLSVQDSSSRAVLVPIPPGNLPPLASYSLFGWPVYVTAGIAEDEALGSGSNQSHLILTNCPKSVHIAESGEIAMSVSTEFAFDANQIGLRIEHKIAFDFRAAGIVVLQGVN